MISRSLRPLLGLILSSCVVASLHAQPIESWSFNSCGAEGATGPEQADCDAEYGVDEVTVVNGVQNWTVPITGTYRLTATGGDGASATNGEYSGGVGATLSGEFFLNAGDVLQVVVGQAGSTDYSPEMEERAEGNHRGPGSGESNGGGGGGTFFVDENDNPLLIAGGGGGTRYEANENGCDGETGEYGTRSSEYCSRFVGECQDDDRSVSRPTEYCELKTTDLGMGGTGEQSDCYGSGGAGFYGDGGTDGAGNGGSSWANGMFGGQYTNGARSPDEPYADGGFGGGGSGEGCSGGGGGGGYSGGDGGWVAGGAGSFNSGDNPSFGLRANRGSSPGPEDGDGLIELIAPVGGTAKFEVIKYFSDDNPEPVEVTISCNAGTPINKTVMLEPNTLYGNGDPIFVEFTVKDFDEGLLRCEVYESVPDGYTPFYVAKRGQMPDFIEGAGIADEVTESEEGCLFRGVVGGEFHCEIGNIVDPVMVTVEKEWINDRAEYNSSTRAKIKVSCSNSPPIPLYEFEQYPNLHESWCFWVRLEADPPAGQAQFADRFAETGSGAADVLNGHSGFRQYAWIGPDDPGEFVICPVQGGNSCEIDERPGLDYITDLGDCADFEIAAGDEDFSCTIRNTRLYEGIPTLGQYGLALLMLLMLGGGLIAVRRSA